MEIFDFDGRNENVSAAVFFGSFKSAYFKISRHFLPKNWNGFLKSGCNTFWTFFFEKSPLETKNDKNKIQMEALNHGVPQGQLSDQ